MDIRTMGVVGAGAMGNGIAEIAAQAWYSVIMSDIEDNFVEGGLTNIAKFLTKSVDKGKITAQDKAVSMGWIKTTILSKLL